MSAERASCLSLVTNSSRNFSPNFTPSGISFEFLSSTSPALSSITSTRTDCALSYPMPTATLWLGVLSASNPTVNCFTAGSSLSTAVNVISAVRAPAPEKITAGFCALYGEVVVSRVTPVLAAFDASAAV